MKILLVDDDDNIRNLISYNLQLDGHTVEIAENGFDCLKKINNNPDLVLLDIMMPEMDGLQTCIKIKANPATHNIPVFMLTAKSQMNDIEEAFKIGADDYLTKPIDPNTLNDRILKKLQRYNESK